MTGAALARLVRASGVLLALLLLVPCIRANEPVPPSAPSVPMAWETARAHLADGNLPAAQATLEAHLAERPLFDVVPQVHVALAAIHHAQGNLGPAAAHIHTARLAQPRDADTKTLQAKIHDELGRPSASLLPLRPDEWLWIAAALWCVLWLLIAIQFALRSKRTRRWFLLPITLLVFALLACWAIAGLSITSGEYRNGRHMVVHPIPSAAPSDEPDAVPTPILPLGEVVSTLPSEDVNPAALPLLNPAGATLPSANLQLVW